MTSLLRHAVALGSSTDLSVAAHTAHLPKPGDLRVTRNKGGPVPMTILLILAALGVSLGGAFAIHNWMEKVQPFLDPSPAGNHPMIDQRHVSFSMGTTSEGKAFLLSPSMLNTHLAVLGATGSGKSRFLSLLMRFHVACGQGFCLVDPAGDLCEDVLAWCTRRVIETGDTALLQKIHYLEPGCYEKVFAYDPFRFNPAKPIAPEYREAAYRAWLHTTVHHIGEIVQLKQGGSTFEGMARLQRVLTDILTATGMAVDETGKHLPLADVFVFLNREHKRHHEVYSRVAPLLDGEIRADFERWHECKNPDRLLTELESTINRLRAILSPVAKAIFAASATTPTIDWRECIRRGDIILWNLRPSEYFSHDQKTTFGKLAIHEILSTMQSIPRDMRRPFTLVVDEAAEFASEQLEWALGAMRKTGLGIVLAGQDLSSFRKKDGFDMAAKVLSQCNSKVCFQEQWPEDLDILARVLGTGNLDFTELVHEVERHEGYEWHEVTEWSEGVSQQANWNRSTGQTESETTNHQQTQTESSQQNWASGSGVHQSPSLRAGSGSSRGDAFGFARGRTKTHTASEGGSQGASLTVSHKLVPLSNVVREEQKSGKLEQDVSVQFEKMKAQIHGLKNRQAVVKLAELKEAFVMETHEVRDVFISPEAQASMVEWIKRELFALQPYYITPSFGPADQDRRLEEFLRKGESPTANDADVPMVVEDRSKNGKPKTSEDDSYGY